MEPGSSLFREWKRVPLLRGPIQLWLLFHLKSVSREPGVDHEPADLPFFIFISSLGFDQMTGEIDAFHILVVAEGPAVFHFGSFGHGFPKLFSPFSHLRLHF